MSKGEHHQCQDVEPKGKPKTVKKREGQQHETMQRCRDGVCPSSATIRRVAHGTFKTALAVEGAELRWEGGWQKQDDKVLCKRREA